MNTVIANRMQQIKPSATLTISAKAAALRADGIDVISLASGEPDFAPAEHILNDAKQAIDDGYHYYTPVDGLVSLKQAIQEKLQRDNGLSYSLEQLIVSTGAKQSVYNVCQVLLNPGDEVIIPAPYWVSYPDMVLLAEGQPVIIDTDFQDNYKITPKQLEAAITAKTKFLILNSPSNPTGMVYSAEELQALAEVLKKHPHVIILSDDIYEHICWSPKPYSNIVMQSPELYDRTIIINGVSKVYAMTGWRIGYAAGPANIIKAMKKLQGQCTSSPNAVAQKAAESALNSSQHVVFEMRETYQRRQQFVLAAINDINGFKCKPTEGAFYLFVDVKDAIKNLGLDNDIAFADYLLENAQVAVVPGTAFGAPGHIRLSYATSDENLKQAMEKIAAAV